MSAFIVSPDCMSRVVDLFVDYACDGMRVCSVDAGMYPARGPFGDLRASGAPRIVRPRPGETESMYRGRMWASLYRLNRRAVAERYGRAAVADMRPEGDTVPYSTSSTRAQRLRSADCLLYQCSEGRVIGSPLYRAIQWACNEVAHAIASDTPEYRAAKWG